VQAPRCVPYKVPSLRAALWLWYRGTHFRGWQRQSQRPTVQETVEEALRGCGIHSGLAAAGRTDRGVHARQQVASLRVPLRTDFAALYVALQGEAWGCAAAVAAPPGFHAQWTPSTKEYRYRLSLGEAPQGWAAFAWDVRREPRLAGADVAPEALAQALLQARGTRDFFAFHAASSARRPRTLSHAEARRGAGGVWELRLCGSGFGRYQVRALVGGAALVAAGRLTEAAWRAALEDAVRFEGMLAPPEGLTLWALDYAGRGPFDAEAHPQLPPGPPFDSVG
jgi:tRNA pseudouridine38-40 synthase